MTLDAVTLAVLKGRLEQIADELDATLYRSAFNPIIAEARDACHGLYHAETGATLVQGTKGLPIFVGAMSFAVQAVIRRVTNGAGLEPGDTFIFNDPYEGGTHLNDFRLVRPVFREGALFCWLASVGHWLDIGGNVPGNYNPRATESHQEGVRFPPVKLIRAGVMQQDILDILAANSRVPQSNWGDLNGQLNALDLGEKRLLDLLDELGVKATFYLVGFRAEACPEVVRRIHRAGHEVGSHTQSHRNAWRIWPWTEARDASRGHDTIANIIGETPGCYRPPFGKVSLPNFLALFRRHTRVDWWTVAIEDTVDTFREPRLVASELVTRAEPVVLMHCHHTEPHRRAYMLAVTRSLVTDARRQQSQYGRHALCVSLALTNP